MPKSHSIISFGRLEHSYKGYQMWNGEDHYNLQLEKHSHLTFCFNVSLMVNGKDLFWYITNYIINEILKWDLQTAHLSQNWASKFFSTADSFLVIAHENDQFWYNKTNMEYESLKWAPETTQLSSHDLKMSRKYFFIILTPFHL